MGDHTSKLDCPTLGRFKGENRTYTEKAGFTDGFWIPISWVTRVMAAMSRVDSIFHGLNRFRHIFHAC